MAILRSPRNRQPLRDDSNFNPGPQNPGGIVQQTQNQPGQPSLYNPVAVTGQHRIPAQAGETPAERGQIPGAGGGAPRAGQPAPQTGPFPHAAPPQPMTPDTSGTGSVTIGSPSTFQPLPSYNPGSLVTSQAGGLAGSLGGLKGGGLGVPLQPSNPALDNPISLLISLLQKGMR